jgi:hypothetical protein
MTTRSWTLLHQADNTRIDHEIISPQDLGVEGSWKIEKRTLHGGLSEGVDEIRVHNGRMSFSIIPTRGMGLWKAWLGDLEIGWKSPVRGPVHPQFVDLGEPSGLGWLDGFDELLVRCGLENNGAPEFDEKTGRVKYPVHGRIANRPAHHVSVTVDTDTQEISVRGIVEETRFHFLKLRMVTQFTTRFNSSAVTIHDEIENFSSSPAEMQMLYHANFGLPLLDGGSRVVVPAKTVVPRNERAASGIKTWDSYPAPTPGFEEMVYFMELHAGDDGLTRALLKNAHSTQGVSLVYTKRQLPCFSLWKNTTAEGDGYVTGLEPGTNFPNPRSYEGENGRVVKIDGGKRAAFSITLEVHPTAKDVAAAEAAVNKIRAGQEPNVLKDPAPKWCHGATA